MATRLFHIGWEQGLVEADLIITNGSTGSPTLSSTKARSGIYSLSYVGSTVHPSYGRAIPSTTELRAFTAVNHNGPAGGNNSSYDRLAVILQIIKLDGTVVKFGWQASTPKKLAIVSANSLIGTAGSDTLANWTMKDVWHDVSIAAKIDATTGFYYMYVNGVEVASFTGNTGTSPIVGVTVGGATSVSDSQWLSSPYFDDLYVEDTTGEAPAPSVNRRFLYGAANGNGFSSTFVGSDSDSVDNYLMVDEVGSNDGDSTYVTATAAAQEDSYTHAPITIPLGYTPVAVIPIATARKTNSLIDTELQPKIYKAAAGSTVAAQDLITAYKAYSGRFTALPDASPLNEANINLTEFGYISAGAYI